MKFITKCWRISNIRHFDKITRFKYKYEAPISTYSNQINNFGKVYSNSVILIAYRNWPFAIPEADALLSKCTMCNYKTFKGLCNAYYLWYHIRWFFFSLLTLDCKIIVTFTSLCSIYQHFLDFLNFILCNSYSLKMR